MVAGSAVALSGCAAGAGPTPPGAEVDEADASRSPQRPSARVVSPVHLSIGSIGVDTRLVRLGLNDDGTVEVPTERGTAGWFRLGPVPGQRGSSVILGHVDSVDGPDVFADLSTMRPGAPVQVGLSDDTVATFEVTGMRTYANADFPADRVYAGTRRGRELNLVTCGGAYDADRGGYQANVVVYTRLTRR
jgi:hypothetical protein